MSPAVHSCAPVGTPHPPPPPPLPLTDTTKKSSNSAVSTRPSPSCAASSMPLRTLRGFTLLRRATPLYPFLTVEQLQCTLHPSSPRSAAAALHIAASSCSLVS